MKKRTAIISLIFIILLVLIYPFLINYLLFNFHVINSNFKDEDWFQLSYTYFPGILAAIATFTAAAIALYQNFYFKKTNTLNTSLSILPNIKIKIDSINEFTSEDAPLLEYNSKIEKCDFKSNEVKKKLESYNTSEDKDTVFVNSIINYLDHSDANYNMYYSYINTIITKDQSKDLIEIEKLRQDLKSLSICLNKINLNVSPDFLNISVVNSKEIYTKSHLIELKLNVSNFSSFNINKMKLSKIEFASNNISFENIYNQNFDILLLKQNTTEDSDYKNLQLEINFIIREFESEVINSFVTKLFFDVQYDFGYKYTCECPIKVESFSHRSSFNVSCYPNISI